MGIELRWEDEEKTIIRWIYSSNFTWEEYDEGDRKLHSMLADINHKFTTIFDLSEMRVMPQSAISQYPKLMRDVPPLQESLIIISHNRLVQSLGRIFTRVYRMNIHFVRTLEDALALIAKQRSEKR
ncbi:MAG: hypothetical protein PVF83_07590 [Anaerolineales bacterium]|jgi:hypothetical protein